MRTPPILAVRELRDDERQTAAAVLARGIVTTLATSQPLATIPSAAGAVCADVHGGHRGGGRSDASARSTAARSLA